MKAYKTTHRKFFVRFAAFSNCVKHLDFVFKDYRLKKGCDSYFTT